MTKPISRKMVVDCLLDRIQRSGHMLICECGEPLLPGQQIQFDHIHGDGMGGPHEYQNLRPIHYDPCHKRKTKRDVAALAKVDRITGVTGKKKKDRRCLRLARPRRKMQSRPFANGHRPMRAKTP